MGGRMRCGAIRSSKTPLEQIACRAGPWEQSVRGAGGPTWVGRMRCGIVRGSKTLLEQLLAEQGLGNSRSGGREDRHGLAA